MKKLIGVIVAIAASLMLASPVLATDPPDGDVLASRFRANRNLLSEDDALIYFEYFIPYDDPIPEEAADETYIFRLMEGGIDVGVVLPYPFSAFDNGYNRGVASFYLENGNWDSTPPNYTLRIAQSPIYFASPTHWDFTIPSSAYTESTGRADNQEELAINVINMAQRLEAYYGYVMVEDSPSGSVLASPVGEVYFNSAIYGIHFMAPSLFLVQLSEIDASTRQWGTDEFDRYTSRDEGTWVETDIETLSGFWGMTRQSFMALIVTFPIIIGSVIVSFFRWHKGEPGLLFSMLVVFTCAIMGWFPPALFATLLQLMAIYLAYVWWSSRQAHFLSFYTMIWFLSTAICLVIEGSSLSGSENTIINDLTGVTGSTIGGLVPILAPVLSFGRGIIRILIWDYSFYTGGYVWLRYFWMVTLSSAVVWQIAVIFAPVFANFLRTIGSIFGYSK